VQVPLPEQPPPPQPENNAPADGVAVKITWVETGKRALQVTGQLIPAGLLITAPSPESVTATGYGATEVNVATTEVAALMLTVQLAAIPQPPPLQPVKEYPLPAVAVSATWVPLAKLAEHVAGQLIPPGLLVTAPAPAIPTVKG
jgi:hypothetical protein